MKVICNKEQCCGCGACEQICPKHCIALIDDNEGFLYPRIDEQKCIQCGQCERVCPSNYIDYIDDKIKNAYVGFAKDNNLRIDSSSGGVFGLLAKSIIEEHGVVYGAAFDRDYSVHHIRVDNKNDMFQLQESKYLQSRIENTFQQVKEDLNSGRTVLFSGTACQVAGLKRFIGTKNGKLLAVDILCHGVPSPLIWKLYLNYLAEQYHSQISQVHFRNKRDGWKHYAIDIQFRNNTNYHVPHNSDIFIQTFLSNVCLRPSCYHCQYKKLNRLSDITLGDAWGIKKIMKELDDDLGTSIIISHSELGESYLRKISSMMMIKRGEVDLFVPPRSDSRVSVPRNPKRNQFFRKANIYAEGVFDWWKREKKKDQYIQRAKHIALTLFNRKKR